MKFTDEQKEVLALLPQDVKESNELTDAAKLILANLMLLNGTDFAKNEGYLFRTNQALKEDTGIKSEKTIIAAVNKLIELGFIERKAGQRKSASEYRLNTVKIQEYTVKIHCKNTVKNYSNKLQYKEENTVKNYSNKLQYNNDEILLIINELQNTVNKLQYKITVIEDELLQYKNYSIKNYSENKNYSTDIDIDKEIESETNDNNDNTEEYNIKDQNEKEIITEDNLEILKENEILNDEIPSDLPPLDIDSFVSMDNEISNNDNISDSDSSKNELEFSIFGNDIISEDENDNDTTVKFINGKFTVVSETEDEITSSSDVEQDNEILNDSNSSDMTMNNSSDTISNNENLSNNDNFEIWGKIQPIFEKTSNKLVEYLFSEYQTIHSQKEIQGTFAQVKRYISLDKEQLNNVSIPSTGTFGILSFKDETYNFIQCNTDPNGKNDNFKRSLNVEKKGGAAVEIEKTSNNVDTAVKMSQVDNYTTDDKKVAPVQPQTANNESIDMCYTMYGVTADEMNDILSHHGNYNTKPSKGAWRQMTIHLHGEQTTVSEALNHFKDKKKDGKEYMECNTFLYYFTPICNEVEKLLKTKTMTDEQYQDFLSIIGKLTRGKFAYWRKVFSNREPRPNFPSEKEMWVLLGCPSVTEKTSNNVDTAVKMSQVDNYTTDDKKVAPVQPQTANTASDNTVVFPDLNELYKMEYNEAIKTLEKFVVDNPNISREQKLYFNQNISSAFAVQLYEID